MGLLKIHQCELLPPDDHEFAQRKMISDRVVSVARMVLENPDAVRILRDSIHLGTMMPERLKEFIAVTDLNEFAGALLSDLGDSQWSVIGKNFALTVMFITRQVLSGKILSVDSEEAWRFVFDRSLVDGAVVRNTVTGEMRKLSVDYRMQFDPVKFNDFFEIFELTIQSPQYQWYEKSVNARVRPKALLYLPEDWIFALYLRCPAKVVDRLYRDRDYLSGPPLGNFKGSLEERGYGLDRDSVMSFLKNNEHFPRKISF